MTTSISEADALAATEHVVRFLTPKFSRSFGYAIGVEDVEQEIRLLCWEAVQSGRYDPSRQTLEAFLWSHSKNRMLNKVRDTVSRSDSPCPQCGRGEPCEADGRPCSKHAAWLKRNTAKRNLHFGLSFDWTADEQEQSMRHEGTAEVDTEVAELLEVIDEALPVDVRRDLLKMRAGVSLPKPRREAVAQAVVAALRAEGYDLAV